jgi:uncharacterized membrane protein YhaH (DUF805 family)
MHYYFIAWRRAFDFSGRSMRAEYWFFALFDTIAIALLASFFALMGVFLSVDKNIAQIPVYVYIAASILPASAVSWRRLHDRGISGWWNLAPLGLYIPCAYAASSNVVPRSVANWSFVLPYALSLGVYIICLLDGEPGPNRFGADPKERPKPLEAT